MLTFEEVSRSLQVDPVSRTPYSDATQVIIIINRSCMYLFNYTPLKRKEMPFFSRFMLFTFLMTFPWVLLLLFCQMKII